MKFTYLVKQIREERATEIDLLDLAIQLAGSGYKLAHHIGINPNAVKQWRKAGGVPNGRKVEVRKFIEDTKAEQRERAKAAAALNLEQNLLKAAFELFPNRSEFAALVGIQNLAHS